MTEPDESLEGRIIKWGIDRGLYDVATIDSQIGKFFEEFSEWMAEVISGNKAAEKVELGDMYVVLTHLAKIRGLSFTNCGESAYSKIKDRTGHTENCTFVKD